MKIYNFDEIGSTNDFAESIKKNGEDAVITARVQTNGHGSKGRSFCSDKGGLYLTKLSFYENFPAKDVFRVMVNASLAVCKTMETFGLEPQIKWPNDIYVKGKKICGMLIGNTFSGDKLSCSVVGIGVNIENEFPEELKDVAVSMKQAGARGYTFESVRAELLTRLQEEYELEEYKRYVRFLGREVSLIEGEKKTKVVALGIDEWGRLCIKEGQTNRVVSAGEVSLRIE